jgi:hypothetical protein
MAAPTLTAVSPNGGSPTGGTVVKLTGTEFTGTQFVHFGSLSAAFTVVSPTEITATVPQNQSLNGTYFSGPVAVTVSTPSGTNVGTGETTETFVYYQPQIAAQINKRTVETVPVGSVKTTTPKSPASFFTFAGAETAHINLQGNYSAYDYITVETNIGELSGTPKLTISLEDSFDNGLTWEKTIAFTETAEVVAGTPIFTAADSEGKQFGPTLRLALKTLAAGGAAGTFTIYSQTGAVLEK